MCYFGVRQLSSEWKWIITYLIGQHLINILIVPFTMSTKCLWKSDRILGSVSFSLFVLLFLRWASQITLSPKVEAKLLSISVTLHPLNPCDPSTTVSKGKLLQNNVCYGGGGHDCIDSLQLGNRLFLYHWGGVLHLSQTYASIECPGFRLVGDWIGFGGENSCTTNTWQSNL